MMLVEWRSILRSWPAWVLFGFLMLFEVLPADRAGVLDGADFLMWLPNTIVSVGFWVGVVAVMLAQRDRNTGMTEVLIPTRLSSLRVVVVQWLALMLAATTVSLLLALLVLLRDPPQTWLGFAWLKLLAPLEMLMLIAALGLMVGHAFRSPLAVALVVLMYFGFGVVQFSGLVAHTLTPTMDFRCSRILGCPDLPYAHNFLLWVAVVVLILGLGFWIHAQQPFNASNSQHGIALGATALAVLVVLGVVPTLAHAAQIYPRPDWTRDTAWPKIKPETQAFDTPSYRRKLACTASKPTVCVLRAQPEMAQRIQGALQRLEGLLPGWAAPNVVAYPTVDTFPERPIVRVGDSIYVAERMFWEARQPMRRTKTQEDAKGQKTTWEFVEPNDFNFVHEVLDFALHGKARGETKRLNGSVQTTYSTQKNSQSVLELYLEWLALQKDPAWNTGTNGIDNSLSKPNVVNGRILGFEEAPVADGVGDQLPFARAIWNLGEKHGHERTVQILLWFKQSKQWRTITPDALVLHLKKRLEVKP